MTMQRRIVPAEITPVGEDEVRVVISTGAVARDGHILIPQGVILDNYRKNNIVLWQHDPEHPVGNGIEMTVNPNDITALVRFAPLGTTVKADETRKLVKSGVVKSVSVGFDPIDGEPLDPKQPRGGMRFTKWELLEVSFVSVPADTGAQVTAREIDSTQEKKPMTKKEAREIVAEYKRVLSDTKTRDLYSVSSLAWLLSAVCGEAQCAKFEAALEGDGSAVPGMLAEAARQLGEAFVEMAKEETDEILAYLDEGDDDDGEEDGEGVEIIVERDRKFINTAPTKRARKFRRAVILSRAGKPISQSNADQLTEADGHHTRALKHHRALSEHQDEMRGYVGDMGTAHDGVRAAHEKAAKAIGDAQANPDDAAKHLDRAAKAVDAAGGKMDKADATHGKMKDANEDMGDTHAAVGRSLKRAQGCVRSVLRGASPSDDEDTDSKKVQTSGGTDDDEGSRAAADADHRAREAYLLELVSG